MPQIKLGDFVQKTLGGLSNLGGTLLTGVTGLLNTQGGQNLTNVLTQKLTGIPVPPTPPARNTPTTPPTGSGYTTPIEDSFFNYYEIGPNGLYVLVDNKRKLNYMKIVKHTVGAVTLFYVVRYALKKFKIIR